MNNFIHVNPDEKVCYNCKHLAWLVALGQGLRCINPTKEDKYKMVPSSKHTCELFEFKTKTK